MNQLVKVFQTKLANRGARGIIGLQRTFKIIDDDNSKTLSFPEFQKACRDFKTDFTTEDCQLLFKAFDRDHNGTVDHNEFLRTVRVSTYLNLQGEMNATRKALVAKAFHKLDKDHSGVIELADVLDRYNASKHPQVMSGLKTSEQVIGEFLENFEE